MSVYIDSLQDVISVIQIRFPSEAFFIGGDFNARVGEGDYIHEETMNGSTLESLRL